MRVRIALGMVTAMAFAPAVAAKGNAHHWETSPHHLSALVGTTYTKECGNAFTLGIDYEYRLSDFLGVGFVAEYAFEDLDAYTYLLVADLHITNNFIAQIGPGVEFHGSHKMEVARLGFLYEFEMSGITVSPQLHYDYHRNHKSAVVAGLAIGMSF
ncbi:hypothetical protein [Alteromonas sp. S005]|uniref:hypothetical protein n=1 Tax=Alteromonas sp. S005 TaxID=3117400 RepID=UPI002FE3DD7F|tara:strand:- start:83 stop:550 length:468 start_codon:yes stop_codon:yes gene_type:complete